MTVGDLKAKAKLNMVNPMLWASMYTLARTYSWDGNTTNELLMLRVGPRVGLTPFYLRFGRRAALVDVRRGDTAFHDGWSGVGVRVRNLHERKQASIDVNVDLWTQPGLELGGTPTDLKGQTFGGAASPRCGADRRGGRGHALVL